jgi:hypothetical protein
VQQEYGGAVGRAATAIGEATAIRGVEVLMA